MKKNYKYNIMLKQYIELKTFLFTIKNNHKVGLLFKYKLLFLYLQEITVTGIPKTSITSMQ